jgi:hypothetical protein
MILDGVMEEFNLTTKTLQVWWCNAVLVGWVVSGI